MSRDSGVTFERVRQACYEILGRGERPSRPSVQELLATERYIGRKGSNDLVQRYITEFWTSMTKTMQIPPRTVEGIPEAFVPILDKALGEMVAIARQLAVGEFAERENALGQRAKEMEAAIQEARDAALAADQLRMRAEGELAALQTRAAELKGSLAEAEKKLADETRKVEAHQRMIGEKDAELGKQFASLEAARHAQEQTSEQHRLEIHRLMQQIDNERQTARLEAKGLREQLEESCSQTAALRDEAAALRETVARLESAHSATAGAMKTLERTLSETTARLDAEISARQMAAQDLTAMRVRYETAEQHRQEALARITAQAEEIGELRRMAGQLGEELAAAREAAEVRKREEERP